MSRLADRERELQRELEENRRRGWGDRRTWLWIGFLVVGSLAHTVIIHWLVGSEVRAEWNLGYPPTAPDYLLMRVSPEPPASAPGLKR
ncbi:MAG: hypothetical protein HY320_13430 [Armatimonadetes bacterium]|nr:hypothetical protein [Armatimonadota bacterium]